MTTFSHSYAILSAEYQLLLEKMAEEQAQKLYPVVAKQTDLHIDILKMLVRDGIIEGDDATCNVDQAQQVAQRLQATRSQVGEQGIVATDVPEKYGFSDTSIYKWHNSGWIRVVGKGRYNARLFSESDIAFLRALADLRKVPPGGDVVPARPRSGRPKTKKKSPLK